MNIRLIPYGTGDVGYVEICGGLFDELAKRERDDQICSHAKTLNHVAIG